MQEDDKKDGFDIAFEGALKGALVSANEGALESRSGGTSRSALRDLKD